MGFPVHPPQFKKKVPSRELPFNQGLSGTANAGGFPDGIYGIHRGRHGIAHHYVPAAFIDGMRDGATGLLRQFNVGGKPISYGQGVGDVDLFGSLDDATVSIDTHCNNTLQMI
jgi:hypothetical protein